jgi:hypothetical protein
MRITSPIVAFYRQHCTTSRFVAVVNALPTVSANALTHVRCSKSDTVCMSFCLSMLLHIGACLTQHTAAFVIAVVDTLPDVRMRGRFRLLVDFDSIVTLAVNVDSVVILAARSNRQQQIDVVTIHRVCRICCMIFIVKALALLLRPATVRLIKNGTRHDKHFKGERE